MQEALQQGKKEWGRSKIMIVGEGRAGKTAVANSIVGTPFASTDSTLGISQLTCSISTLQKGQGVWQKTQSAGKEFEAALAQIMTDKASKSGSSSGEDADGGSLVRELNQMRGVVESANDLTPIILDISDAAAAAAATAAAADAHTAKPPPSTLSPGNAPSPNKASGARSAVQGATSAHDQAPSELEVLPPTHEIDEGEVMKCVADNAQTNTALSIRVYDYGGQSVFNVIHHLFLTQYGVYALCFSMEWLLPSAPEGDKERCLKYLRFWLNSIVLHTYDTTNNECAPVVLIGTHGDIVDSPADHEKISHVLELNFGSSWAWPCKIENREGEGKNGRAILAFFPVDNKKGRDNDPQFQYMMRLIEERMDSAKYTHREVPLNWLKTMDAFKSTKKSFLSFTEVQSIAVSCGVKRNHVEAFLRLLHEMGYLLWNEEPNLRELVILDAIEYLVKPATLVVCNLRGTAGDDLTRHNQPQHIAAAKNHRNEWSSLKNSGVLKKPLLQTLWADYVDETEHLLTLMIKFGLLVPLDPPDSEDGEQVEAADLVEQFVVPALLPPSPPGFLQSRSEWGDGRSTPRTAYIVFTLTDLKSHSSFNVEDMKTGGFMPSGLFERVLGGCISWSQAASKAGFIRLEEMATYSDCAVLEFGSQTFRIVPLPELNCLRIDVEGSNPLPVVSRILEIAEEVIASCMKSLQVFVAVPWQDVSDPSPKAFEDSGRRAAMLIPLDNLRKAVEGNKALKQGGRNLLSLKELTTDYVHWLNIYKDRDWYDVFLSYRWGSKDRILSLFDSKITEQVFDAMSNFALGSSQRRVEVFLDVKRLQKGEAFDSAFAKALVNSTVVVPLMSASALSNMTKHDAQCCDNVLLEWLITSECMKAKGANTLIRACYPIFIGNITESAVGTGQVIGDFFASGILSELPTCTPTATIRMAKKLLLENNVTPSPALDNYTVASFISEFRSMLGYKVECKARKLPSRIARDAHEIASRFSADHGHDHDQAAAEQEPQASLSAAAAAAPAPAPAPAAVAPVPAAAPAAAAGSADTPLQKLYAILTNPKKAKDPAALQAYLQDNLAVTSAEDLNDYLDMDDIKDAMKAFLIEGGQKMFDRALDALKA